MASPDTRTCKQAGCGGPASGTCIEKLSFDECPYVISGEADPEQIGHTQQPIGETSNLISTGNTASLDAAACDALLREQAAIIVAVIAGPYAGKTTLLATLYELLRKAKLDGFSFAGSETIRGFEERCFLSRVNSGRDKADTQHTPARAGLNFTHLRVKTPDRMAELLLADRSGEYFQRVQNTPNLIAEFEEFYRADVIILVMDGQLLTTDPHRQISESRKLLLALSGAGLLPLKPLKIVITKNDLVSAGQNAEIIRLVGTFVDECRRRVLSINVSVHYTAARPLKGETKFGEGILNLIRDILIPPPSRDFIMKHPNPTNVSGASVLLLRLLGERNGA